MSDNAKTEDAEPKRSWAQMWWSDLQTRDRAGRARLRRADLDAAMIDEATLRLFNRLGRRSQRDLAAVAVLAIVLAAVREDDGRMRFAQQIGFKAFPKDPRRLAANEKPALSVLRFKALMAAESEADVARQFRRAVDIVGGRANVRDLEYFLLRWRNEDTRRRFVFDYYAAADAAPPTEAPQTPDTVTSVLETPASS